MRRDLVALAAIAALGVLGGVAGATTVTFNVVPAADTTATSVTVAPAAEVPYLLVVQVTSDNPAALDNNGLAFFSVNITTNLGVTQRPLDSFASVIASSFPAAQSLGTPSGDNILQSNIIQIGGGQNTLTGAGVTTGIGIGSTPQLIGTGRFLTSTTQGTFRAAVASTSQANAFLPVSNTSTMSANVAIGPGFSIVTTTQTTPTTTPTIRFSVVPAANNNATSVSVTPGSEVAYQLFAQVISGSTTTPDNNGLASFSVNIITTSGITQQPLDSFSTAISQGFPNGQSLGIVQDGNILQISGSQPTGGTGTAGIASGTPQLIGQGRLLTPTTEGSFTVSVGPNSQGTAFAPGSTSTTTNATVQAGAGFTVVTTTQPATPTGTTSSAAPLVVGLIGIGVTALVVWGLFMAVSPFAAMLAIVLLPLLFIAVAKNFG